jgi:hypothetical protein
VDDILKSGQGEKEVNYFTHNLKNQIPFDFFGNQSFPDHPQLDSFLRYLKLGDYNTNEKLPELLFYPLTYYLNLVGELVLESIRAKEFKGKPSRQKCFWLVGTQSEAEAWVSKLEFAVKPQIVKVRADGNTFRCDASLLKYENETLSDIEDKARLYWAGNSEKPFKEEEILFEGNLEVIEVLSNNKD